VLRERKGPSEYRKGKKGVLEAGITKDGINPLTLNLCSGAAAQERKRSGLDKKKEKLNETQVS